MSPRVVITLAICSALFAGGLGAQAALIKTQVESLRAMALLNRG